MLTCKTESVFRTIGNATFDLSDAGKWNVGLCLTNFAIRRNHLRRPPVWFRTVKASNHYIVRLLVAVLFSVLAIPTIQAKEKLPNIVIILADDLGYGDLGCYGHPSIRTPHLDRMAAEGMRFTDFYVAASVCTPSRAGLLTGRLPLRSGMAGGHTNHVLFTYSRGGLPAEEITIARALKSKGYATACVGKWHLGHQPPFLPTSHGFDFYFGVPFSNDMEPTAAMPKGGGASMSLDPKEEWWHCSLMRNGDVIEKGVEQGTLTRRYTEEVVKFIRENKAKPFFVYLPHTFPHIPLFASSEFKGKSKRGLYGDAVEELDWSVGEIMAALRREKLAENTLVFFTSDNGPWRTKGFTGGSAGLLRDGKASTWEGGMRVPAVAWWPGKIPAGRINRGLASSLDFFSTILALSKIPLPDDRPVDGFDLSATLLKESSSPRETVFFYFGSDLYAVRMGNYKAHFFTHDGYSKEPPRKLDRPLLYDLAHDPSERFDLAGEKPDVLAGIVREVEKHRGTMKPGKPQY